MATSAAPKIDPAVMSKIQKLLSRTAQTGCTQEEAATAFSMAQRLMTEANITMEEVRGSDAAGGDNDWKDEVIGTMGAGDWTRQQDLGAAIVRDFFFVQVLRNTRCDNDGNRVHDFHIFGRPSNVETAKFVFTSLMRSFYTLWEDFRINTGAPKSDRAIFMVGVAKGFRDKLTQERKADEAERDILSGSTGGTSIVLASVVAKTIEAFHKAHPNTFQRKSSTAKGSQSSFDSGYERGRKLSLHRGVGGKGQGKLS
jgi:hypothetical protein